MEDPLIAESLTSDFGRPGGLWARIHRFAGTAARFFFGQGMLQGINILLGLYLVRALSIESYAQFGLAQGFQQTVALLMDLGFATTIIPLVGDRANDRSLVGRYVRSAKHLRDRSFFVLAPLSVLIFAAIMHHRHWSWYAQAALIVSVLVCLYSGGKMSYFGAPLILYGELASFYVPQTLVGGARLLLAFVLKLASALTGWTAALVTALGFTLNGQLLERECRRHIVWPEQDDAATDREVLRYILPAVPALVFSAFQMQSSIFLISIFGQTSGIAQIAALSRLAQIFSILAMFATVVLEPAMARLPFAMVPRRYALLVGVGAAGCSPIALIAFWKPGIVLWVLGAKYAELGPVVGWAMLAASINFLSTLMWILNRSRKWVFWSGTFVEIGLVLSLQIAYLSLHGLRSTSDAVFFGLTSAIGPIVTHTYVMIVGMSTSGRNPRPAVSA